MFKKILPYCIMWLGLILLYVLNLVIVCVKGATMARCICGLASCIILAIMLAIDNIVRVYQSEKKWEEAIKKLNEEMEKGE